MQNNCLTTANLGLNAKTNCLTVSCKVTQESGFRTERLLCNVLPMAHLLLIYIWLYSYLWF